MVCVFSFTLFGDVDKYCKGLLRNIEIIQKEFPDFQTWVYLGNDIPVDILNTLNSMQKVKCIFTGETGIVNKFYRFFAIDDPEVEVMFVRDVDSRILKRDISTIHDFLASDKKFHIVRDHPNHFHKVLAGIFAIRKGLLAAPLKTIFDVYRQTNDVNTFWNDQEFLASLFWPHVLPLSMIHDDLQEFEPYTMKTPIKVPIGNALHFIGQVYEFDEAGTEYPKFTDFFEGGVHGKSFFTQEKLERLGICSIPIDPQKLNLFIQIFQHTPKETDTQERKTKLEYRNKEFEKCFLINTNQDFIQRLYIFYEKEEDAQHYRELAKENASKCIFIKHNRQAHYKDFLVYINQNIPENEICCIVAGDIYFNSDIDLMFFKKFLPHNTMFSITRHELTDEYHILCNEDTCELTHGHGGCSDCFIFRTPIPASFPYEQVDHRQNRQGGECNFCSAWHRAGGEIYNPAYQVKTIHVHKDSYYPNDPNIISKSVTYGRPYLPELEKAPLDSNHCINRPSSIFEPGTIVCFRCKAHPNIFCKWHKGGRDWTCSICAMYNKFEEREWSRYRVLHPESV
jgi:hypothetical protein